MALIQANVIIVLHLPKWNPNPNFPPLLPPPWQSPTTIHCNSRTSPTATMSSSSTEIAAMHDEQISNASPPSSPLMWASIITWAQTRSGATTTFAPQQQRKRHHSIVPAPARTIHRSNPPSSLHLTVTIFPFAPPPCNQGDAPTAEMWKQQPWKLQRFNLQQTRSPLLQLNQRATITFQQQHLRFEISIAAAKRRIVSSRHHYSEPPSSRTCTEFMQAHRPDWSSGHNESDLPSPPWVPAEKREPNRSCVPPSSRLHLCQHQRTYHVW